MIGLPGATLEDELSTAKFIIESGAFGARIYPTVVFADTELCNMTMDGEYEPLELDEAVMRSAAVFKLFYEANVKVVRIGLCSSENLSGADTYFAGPNHPAIGELVLGELYYLNIKEQLGMLDLNNATNATVTVKVAKGQLSKAIGQKKKNRLKLLTEFGFHDIHFLESEDVQRYDVRVEVEERTYKCI